MRALPWSAELRGFFPKVAEAARLVVPFQGMEIGLLEETDTVRVWALGGLSEEVQDRLVTYPGLSRSQLRSRMEKYGLAEER